MIKSRELESIIAGMPYFLPENLLSLGFKRHHLNMVLSRLKKRGDVVLLKRGMYVSVEYLNKVKRSGEYNKYLEMISGVLYSPSYLSLEYVLNEHNILSEASFSFSLVSNKKTFEMRNDLGLFRYRSIKESLFTGFKVIRKGDFLIYKATPAKALFDFLYFRKNIITGDDFLESFRINKEAMKASDLKEFKRYILISNNKRMKEIGKFYAH